MADPGPSVREAGEVTGGWVAEGYPANGVPWDGRTEVGRVMDAAGPVDRCKGDFTEVGMGLPANMAFVYSVMPASFSLAVLETNGGPRVEMDGVAVETKVVGGLWLELKLGGLEIM